jgi:hypothetical protein
MKPRHRNYLFISAIVVGACLVWPYVCSTARAATIWYVSPSGNDANAGTSWAAAKRTVQAAVNAATGADTVLVTNGVYVLSSSLNITNAIALTSVNGSSSTILDGQHASRCVTIDGVAATVNGFTLQNGRAAVVGGGAYCNGGTIQNCLLANNQAIGDEVNTAQGGGVYVAYGTLSNCVVVSNVAENTNSYSAAWGGGVNCYGSIVHSCLVSNNLCSAGQAFGGSAFGGGVFLTAGELRNSRVLANSATALSTAYGGGVYATIMQLAVPSLVEVCVVASNNANTTDTDLYTGAESTGGGLYIGNGTTVRSTLVYRNIAQSANGFTSAGGVSAGGSTLENCTIANNQATTQNGHPGVGGGVTWGVDDQCYNNIIKLNSADNGSDNGEIDSLSYPILVNSDLGPIVPAAKELNCISADPLFVNAAGGDYRLQPASPCVSAGTNMDWMVGALDLAGNNRLSGGIVDIGAYEYVQSNPRPALNLPTRPSGSQFRFLLNGTGGQNYTIQYSVTLTNWTSLLVTNAPTSSFTVTDSSATNAFRFYRVLVGP